MAKLVTKFKYLKPDAPLSVGGYAKYIGTREGVEKIDDTFKLAPATGNQKKLINRILKDFPDSREMLEYADYLSQQTAGAASEFISRAVEDNADEMVGSKTYADYIATRPGAERHGTHGLFTKSGEIVQLSKVSEELNAHEGNVWTLIKYTFLYRTDLPHRAISVYIYLADRANKDNLCWPAIPTIAKELKMSKSTVRRALQDLRNEGLLETEQRYRTKGGKSSLLYKLKGQ